MSQPAAPLRSRVPRIAGAAVERARLTVVPRTRAMPAARVPFVLLVSLILLLGVVGLLMFNTSMQQASFAMDTYQDRAVSLAAREEQLAAELEEQRDPQTLADRARRHGMVPPACTAYLDTATGAVTGQPCVAKADMALPRRDRTPVVPLVLDPPPVVVTVPPVPTDVVPEAATGASADAEAGEKSKKPGRDKNKSKPKSRP